MSFLKGLENVDLPTLMKESIKKELLEIIELIREINKKRGIILFLDPDSPGEKIRNRLNTEIPNLKNAFVLKENAKTKAIQKAIESYRITNEQKALLRSLKIQVL